MARKACSLSHAKLPCEHHIVFTPKYGRKVIHNQTRKDIEEILRRFCRCKGGIEIIEGHQMSYHVHMLLVMRQKYSMSSLKGYLKIKGLLKIFDKHANTSHEFSNGKFWVEGYYASTAGLNEATIAKCV